MSKRYILAFETSCDDTSVAIMESENNHFSILKLLSFNQDILLSRWGGVVPEISARQHAEILPEAISEILTQSKIELRNITDIAVTTHPGLIGPLLTGLQAAKTLSMFHQIDITPVHHLKAHLEAIHLSEKISYPYLGLLVSGGHTQIYWVSDANNFELIGSTLDDAAGEAFDKGGKLMGLPYPAGRFIDEKSKLGNIKKYPFPISYLKDRPGKMSFSGLKTSLRYFIEKNPELIQDHNHEHFYNLCASYQHTIVQTLIIKLQEVIEKLLPKNAPKSFPIVVGGGVAANSYLRSEIEKKYPQSFFVKPQYCTDNAAMIAMYAHLHPELKISYPQCLELDASSSFTGAP